METKKTKTVVIIEDDPDTLDMFAEMMSLGGFQVHKSFGGFEVIDLLVNVHPDIIVMDIMMPKLSGIDLLRIIRSDSRISHIPVLVVSAKSLPLDILRGMGAGASGYLAKPVTYQDLKETVNNLIDQDRSNPVSD